MWLGDRLGCVIDGTSMLTLLELIPAKCSSQCHDVLYSAVIHTVHTIWMAQNVVRYIPDGFSLHAATTKVYVCITLSGLSSNGKSLLADVTFLNSFSITPNYRQRGQIISVICKTPTHPWVKVNADGSLLGGHASCGGIFRDHKGSFLSCFASNLGQLSFLEAEIHGFLLAMEYVAQHQ